MKKPSRTTAKPKKGGAAEAKSKQEQGSEGAASPFDDKPKMPPKKKNGVVLQGYQRNYVAAGPPSL